MTGDFSVMVDPCLQKQLKNEQEEVAKAYDNLFLIPFLLLCFISAAAFSGAYRIQATDNSSFFILRGCTPAFGDTGKSIPPASKSS